MALGKAFIEVHADTKPFGRELRADLDKYLAAADAKMKKAGAQHGKSYSQGFKGEFKNGLKDVDKEFQKIVPVVRRTARRAATGARTEFKKGFTDINKDASRGLSMVGNTLLAFTSSSLKNLKDWGSGISGIFGTVGSSMGPQLAIYAGIAVAAIGLVIGALGILTPIVFGLVGAFVLLGSAFVGVLFGFAPLLLAFKELAKIFPVLLGSTKDFNKALDKIAPGLRPIAELLRSVALAIKKLPLGAFFTPLIKPLGILTKFLESKTFQVAFQRLGQYAGTFAANLLKAIETPQMQKAFLMFVQTIGQVFNALSTGGSAFLKALTTIFSDPAFQTAIVLIAQALAGIVVQFSTWLSKAATDGSLTTFLNNALTILDLVWGLVQSIFNLLSVFFTPDQQKNARHFLLTITDAINIVAGFLASKKGQQFVTDMANILTILGAAAIATILILGLVDGAIHTVIGTLKSMGGAIGGAWNTVASVVTAAINAMITAINHLIDALNKIPFINIPHIPSLGSPTKFNLGGGSAAAAAAGGSGHGGGKRKGGTPSSGGKTPTASADGNIFTRPSMTLIGEGNKPEVVIPLTKPGKARALADKTGLTNMLTGNRSMGDVYVFVGNEPVDARVERALDNTANDLARGPRL